ncbi:vacuolar protein sorting-associated protein 41 homolog [Ptychodera flava]|uniref:vacuolar protein sorting-associated protein 41 homolog n=1 Tax=Ptychodera flava TaxID=63121 RepID=UPI00396A76C9
MTSYKMADRETPEERDGTETEEEEEEEEEEEGSTSDESEIQEPKLKYERIGNDMQNILDRSQDAASCLAVHSKFLAVGTHWGIVHVLDHQGNSISNKEFASHTTTVNQISLDDNGDYIASCSDDGRVAINGLYETEDNQLQALDYPVKAVALDPKFSKPNSGKQYVTGGTKLVLNERGWLNRLKTTVLHQGEGQIRTIKWRSHFIAWANDLGVKIYDVSSKRRITFIARDHDPSLRPEIYRCHLCWRDDITLLIGWADRIKICKVKERAQNDARDLPNRYVEIVSMFKTDFYVCGIAPLGESLVIMSYVTDGPKQEDEKEGARRPQLRIIDPKMDDFEEISCDALSIRGFHEYRPNDYHLEHIEEENLFYIVSPKDVVVAKPRDLDDHITWLMEHEMFQEALADAEANSRLLKRHDLLEIGRSYLNYLLDEQKYDEAARQCVKVLGKNKELWENEVFKFAKIHQLKAIAPYVPRGDMRLSQAIYEMILNDYLQTDYEGFNKLIKEWPHTLYDLMTIVNAVQERLDRDPEQPILLKTLGELYTYDKRYDRALAIYLKLGHKDVFQLIHKHNLFDSIQDKIVLLMEFDTEQATRMLVDNMERVPIEKVVTQLGKRPKLQYVYLDAVFQKDPHISKDFHALQVGLYAEFDRARLKPFLRNSNYYPLQRALEVCEQRHYIPEMVFLLGRMGNTKQALQLITEELHDVDQAIEFAKEHDDEELWEDLIMYSMDKPKFITGLLRSIGTHVDPILLIRRIRERMEIPGLRDSLVKILQDYNLQISLREGCKKILVSDCFSLMEKLNKIQKRGIRVDDEQSCPACHGPLTADDARRASNIVVFFCRHTFHEDCLPAHNMETCNICHAQRKRRGVSIFKK